MSIPSKYEQSQLSHDEIELIRQTHHPALYELDGKALRDLTARVRAVRDKEKTFARQKTREVRGKAEARGQSFPGTAAQPQRRKQIFAAALKRLHKEVGRLRKLERRETNVEAAHRALALRRAAAFVEVPHSGATTGEGMRPIINARRGRIVLPSTVGSISQATKKAQAVRDARR